MLRSSENLTKNDYKKENDEGNFYFNYLSPFVVDFIFFCRDVLVFVLLIPLDVKLPVSAAAPVALSISIRFRGKYKI